MQQPINYTFGDNDRAAERLYWLARTFDAETLGFVRASCKEAPESLVDLGAGPGFLTRTLHHGLAARRSIGLEASQRFVELGRADLDPAITLMLHDVTQPLPVRAELMVARFLLTHLGDPVAALRVWAESATGMLLLEELVQMSCQLPVLARYYELVADVQRAAGHDMHIGARLAALANDAGLHVIKHEIAPIELPVRVMTRLHALNLPTLRLQAVVAQRYAQSELDAMQNELEQLATTPNTAFVRVEMARCQAHAA